MDKELANIRKQFTPKGGKMSEDGSNPALSSYQRKKYVWKLVYIHVLGYDVDFVVDTNPSASGNLANVLNQLQTAGTGNILIDLPFLSTQL